MDGVLKFLNDNSGALTAVASIIIAILTFVYARLTRKLVNENILLREVATEPSLSVHITLGERIAPSVIELVIANHGRGTATDITWEISPSPEELKSRGVRLDRLELLNGLPQLAPGQQIRAFLGTTPDLLDEESVCPNITITARYQGITGKRYTSRFTLSPAQFKGLIAVEAFSDVQIARSLEKIEKALTKLTCVIGDPSGLFVSKRLHVATVTEEELREERRKLEERVIASQNQAAETPNETPQ